MAGAPGAIQGPLSHPDKTSRTQGQVNEDEVKVGEAAGITHPPTHLPPGLVSFCSTPSPQQGGTLWGGKPQAAGLRGLHHSLHAMERLNKDQDLYHSTQAAEVTQDKRRDVQVPVPGILIVPKAVSGKFN